MTLSADALLQVGNNHDRMIRRCLPHSNCSLLHDILGVRPELATYPFTYLNAIMASGTEPIAQLEEKPTILIIQDCFQTPAVYKDLLDRLVSLGYPTVHPLLPTCDDAQDPNFSSLTLLDDAMAVQSELMRLVQGEQKTVVVVMHGYGGLVGSEAILGTMSYSWLREHGLPGGVVHLFFVSALLVSPGGSMPSHLGVSPNPIVEVNTPFLPTLILLTYLPFISPMAAIL